MHDHDSGCKEGMHIPAAACCGFIVGAGIVVVAWLLFSL